MGIIAKTVSIAATAFLAAGCASAPHYPAGHEASAGQLVKPHNEQDFSIARKATGISHASWVYARSVYENPINRPVSHFATLGSLALKSTGGMLRRVVIGVHRGGLRHLAFTPVLAPAFLRSLDRGVLDRFFGFGVTLGLGAVCGRGGRLGSKC